MEEEKCTICSRKSDHQLLMKYNGENAFLCNQHAEEYRDECEFDILLSPERHSNVLDRLIKNHLVIQIHNIKQNVDYMSNIMNSWEDGCLSHTEALGRVASLGDSTVNMALSLLEGGS